MKFDESGRNYRSALFTIVILHFPQVSEYLGVKSFKRRYPFIQRRNVDHEERDFLVEIGVVTVVQADLGLTAIPSSQVLDIMSSDFYEKYDEYMAVVAERKDRSLRQSTHNYYHTSSAVSVPVEKHKLQVSTL